MQGSVLFGWQRGDSAATYQVSLSTPDGDSTVYLSGILADTTFLLTDSLMSALGLPPETYSLRYRKECIFETDSFRTSTWSGWSSPRRFLYRQGSTAITEVYDGTFTLTPNPTTGWVTLAFDGMGSATVDVMVTDLTGREVWRREGHPTGQPLTMELDGLAAGTYIVRVEGEGVSFSRKLLVE